MDAASANNRPSRQWFVIILVTMGITSCTGGGQEQLPSRPAQSFSAPSSASTGESPAPDVLHVTCTDSVPILSSDKVVPQRDGIHALVRNATPVDRGVGVGHVQSGRFIQAEFGFSGIAMLSPAAVEESVWIAPPGLADVFCRQEGEQLTDQQLVASSAEFDVLDPLGIFVPVQGPVCQGAGAKTYQLSLPPQLEDENDQTLIARLRLQGLRRTDELLEAGYPEQRHGWVQVLRKGIVVALARFLPGDSGFVTTCNNSGITPIYPS
jgi:hypothetical protein